MTELAQIMNQILGLSTQVEQLQAYQEQISSHIQSAATQTLSIERTARGTNLAMEGIARKTDDNHEYLRLLEQSIKQLRETQLDTGSLREGVHQLISDSFIRLQRYLEQRYPAGQPLDLGRVRVEAQRDLAADLLRKLEHILKDSEENGGYQQSSEFPTLPRHAALLHQEVATLGKRQEKALHLLDSLRQDTPLFRRLVFSVAEQRKRERVIAELAQLIKSNSQDTQNLSLADNLSQYLTEVNAILNALRELRHQLLTLWAEEKLAANTADSEMLDLNSAALPTATTSRAKYDNEEEEDNDNYAENFQVDDTELLFKSDQP